jgi:nitroreductase
MDALTALHTRVSVSKLCDPSPDAEQRQNIFRAALRAADHARLTPWRFLIIEGEGRERLGDLFALASRADAPQLSEEKLQSIRRKALRSPMVIVAICSPQAHPKVPMEEQEYSTAAAVQNMLNAAHAQHIGAIWRTGPMAVHPQVTAGLGLHPHEKIIGFLYIGHIAEEPKAARELSTDDYFAGW